MFTPQELDLLPNEVVAFTLGKHPVTGDPIKRMLYLGANEIAELEDLLGGALGDVLTDKRRGKVGIAISILWVGMKVFEPELKAETVGRMLSREMGRQAEIWEAINQAVRRGMPGMYGDEAKDVQHPLPQAAVTTQAATSA